MQQLTVHTERGVFVDEKENFTPQQAENFQTLLKYAAAGEKESLSLYTPTGYVVIGRELLKTAVFVVENVDEID